MNTLNPTETKAFGIFVVIASIIDAFETIDNDKKDLIAIPDEEDTKSARELRAALIKLNDVNFSHDLFNEIHSFCTYLFEDFIYYQKPFTVNELIDKLINIINELKDQFSFIRKQIGHEMTAEECANAITLAGIEMK